MVEDDNAKTLSSAYSKTSGPSWPAVAAAGALLAAPFAIRQAAENYFPNDALFYNVPGPQTRTRMPKRFRGRAANWAGAGRSTTKFRRGGSGFSGGGRPMRGRYAGYYRKSGYYGRFNKGSEGRQEQKFFDTAIDDASIANTLVIKNLCVIAQDASENGRIGRKCTIRSISWRVALRLLPSSSNDAATIVRCFIVQDTQTNGAIFAANQLFDADLLVSFRNLANSGRFKILWSRIFNLNHTAGSGRGVTDTLSYGEHYRWIQGGKKVGIKLQYDDSAASGVITSMRTNNIYWCTMAITGTLAGTDGLVRIRFTDN